MNEERVRPVAADALACKVDVFATSSSNEQSYMKNMNHIQAWFPWVSKQEGLTKISDEFQKQLIGSQKLSKLKHTKAK